VTAPALSPVTRPVLDTTATASLLEVHPTTRSVPCPVRHRSASRRPRSQTSLSRHPRLT
jgi:hypothetical protein